MQRLAVLPFEIDDNSGEAGSPARHDHMLAKLTRAVAEQIELAGRYAAVPPAPLAKAIADESPGTYLRRCNGCELDIARSVGADQVMIGWIFKMSSLVLTLHVNVKCVASGNLIYARLFDFRGDNERAWRHAAAIMVKDLGKHRTEGRCRRET